MSKKKPNRQTASPSAGEALFQRVAAILDATRSQAARSVNTNMVLAYWLIGSEIVHELQGGENRAEYGKRVVQELAARLTKHDGKGFSAVNLWLFRQFDMTFADRMEILYPTGRELSVGGQLDATSRDPRLAIIRRIAVERIATNWVLASAGVRAATNTPPVNTRIDYW
jgi:hypothetical protein